MGYGRDIGIMKLKYFHILEILELDGLKLVAIFKVLVDMIDSLIPIEIPQVLCSINLNAKEAQPLFQEDTVISISISGPGDVLGIAINLPKIPRSEKDKVDVIIDPVLLKRLWDPTLMKEYAPFKVEKFETVPGSSIEYFKNGVSMGLAFEKLNFGIWY
jgi:hypothetical protein